MFSIRSASASTSGAYLPSNPDSASTRALLSASLAWDWQPVELVVGIGQLVGDDEAGHEQQADLADPAHALRKLLRAAVDVGRELGHMLFLPVVAGDRIPPPADGDRNLAHGLA